MAETWTVLRVLEWTTQRFVDHGAGNPRLEAQVLLAHALGCDRMGLYTRFDQPLGEEELAAFRGLIRRRLAGESVAYLVGEQEFWSRPFAVDARVLVPRPDSETVIEVVLDALADRAAPLRLADLGTGSGALGITLLCELPAATGVLVDVSDDALSVARTNVQRHGLDDRVELRHGDLVQPLAGERFDVIVANLPYVPAGDIAGLDAEVRVEPRLALDGGPDGLDLIRRLVAAAPANLASSGLLVLEHGFDQDAAVRGILDATGAFTPAATRADLAKRPRVTFARTL